MHPMALRAPVHLWRFLASDLLRCGGLAAVLLVLVIAFAASLPFLAEGRVDLAGALRFTILAMVPMLQYALPFAGAFGAALAYHRFAAENELWAAMSGGVSHRALLVPAAAAAAAVSIAVFALTAQVIPRFLRAMEEVVAQDLTGVITRSIEQGESARLGHIELFARSLVRAGPDPAVAAVERLRLSGVLAAALDSEGRVTGFLTADDVSVWLYDEEADGSPGTTAQFLFRGAAGEGLGDALRSGALASHRIRVPSGLRDNPKFLTASELASLRHAPQRLAAVDSRRRTLIRRLAERRVIDSISDALASSGAAQLERPGGEAVLLRAAGLRGDRAGWTLEPAADGMIRVERRARAGQSFTLVARSARVEAEHGDRPGPVVEAPSFRLVLTGSRPADQADDATPSPGVETIPGLAPPESPTADLSRLGVDELLALTRAEAARLDLDAAQPLRLAAAALDARARDLFREITSKQHERAAAPAACFVTLLVGAVAAMRRPQSLVLPVYLWAFFPALAAVITISAGQRLTHKTGDAGLFLLWGGVAALALLLVVEYRRLIRN